MTEKFRGEVWAEFIAGLRDRSLRYPFIVKEEPPDGGGWYLYASSEQGIVYVITSRRERRFWKTIDGAINELARELPEFPAVTIHSSPDAIQLDSPGFTSF